MQQYIIRRLIIGAFSVFVISVVVFGFMQLAPGDPAIFRCGLNCEAKQLDAIREQFGYNDPYYPLSLEDGPPFIAFHSDSQYGRWVKSVATFDLGNSIYFQKPVRDSLFNGGFEARYMVTLELMLLTMILTIAVGIPFGVISAIFRNSPIDYLVRVTAIGGLSVPNFWIATLVLIIPLELWNYAPPIGEVIGLKESLWGNLKQFGPPSAVLALASAAGIMRLSRSSLLEVLRADYMRTARAKGLRERAVILQHGLKNSMIPVVTVLGLQMAGLLGGALILEQIFALPGMGQYTFLALVNKDYEVVQTMTIYAAGVVILLNLLVDISYAWLDPRIRYS